MRRNSICLKAVERLVTDQSFLNKGKVGIVLLLLVITLPLRSQQLYEQTAPEKYRVVFADKNGSPFTPDHPEAFLSPRAIERRHKQGIVVDYHDIPVSPFYIDSIRNAGVAIHNVSRWFNAVTFITSDEGALNEIVNMSFVEKIVKSTPDPKKIMMFKSSDYKTINNENLALDYGLSRVQTDIHHGSILHENGFTGQGIHIAVIDNGFYKVNELPAFSELWMSGRILGTRDFADQNADIFEEGSHGMKVFSIIGGFMPGMLIGTATGASFWLLRSEDDGSEYIIEEDNWISAAEFADSAGVDIINTSLGYTTFDNPLQDHTFREMDGNTTRISRAADIAASKGMLVVISAGNEGQTGWRYISAPADADSILAVGAVDANCNIAPFSSRGPAYDGRIKPDVVAMGKGTYYVGTDGGLWQADGTSLSAPVVSGLAACLWQANPYASAMEIREAILESSHLFTTPDTTYGYGIPDFNIANILLNAKSGTWEGTNKFAVFPNPFRDDIYILFDHALHSSVDVELFDRSGTMVISDVYTGYEGQQYITITHDLHSLPTGIYIMRIETDAFTDVCKIIKN